MTTADLIAGLRAVDPDGTCEVALRVFLSRDGDDEVWSEVHVKPPRRHPAESLVVLEEDI